MSVGVSDEMLPVMIFFRAEGFYPVSAMDGSSLREQAAEHAALNPGTLRVEDIDGNVLWRADL